MKSHGRIGLTCAVMLFVGLVAGCGTGQKTGGGEMGSEEPMERMEREMIELPFKHVTLEDTPEPVQRWIEENRSQEQKQVFHVGGKTYVVVMLGQKPTGGYEVKITQIAEIEGTGTISVTHKVTEPEEGDMVTQVITYPLAIAEMDGERDQAFQFTTPLKEEELDELRSDDLDQSISQDVRSGSQTQSTHSAGAAVELVPPQRLTEEGKGEGGESPSFEGESP